jgi:hypothetical protein
MLKKSPSKVLPTVSQELEGTLQAFKEKDNNKSNE